MKTARDERAKARVDVELAVAIREALHHDDRLSADSVDVTVLSGIATLNGTVYSHRRKLAAIEVAESIDGCLGVIDKIVVNPPGSLRDEEIAANVRSSLESHEDVTKEVITVSVKAGIVTLQGNVASRWERELAQDVALGARGVREVRNMLLVDLSHKIEDEALTTTIQHAISRTSGLRNQPVQVAVNANTAVLSGEVIEPWQRRRAESVVSRFRVTEVRNDIIVRGR